MNAIRSTASLTLTLARSEFKLRYAGSVFGVLWTAAKPLALFGVLYFAFSYVMRLGGGVDRYPLQLLLAIVLWSFFAETTMSCTSVLVSRADMIRKISFPRIVLPLAVSGTALMAMLINLAIVLLITRAAGAPLMWTWLGLVPLIVELVVFSIGVGLLLASVFVRFRDLGQIWEVALQLLFYATPIIYPLTLVPPHLRGIVLANPLAQIIEDARQVVIAPIGGTGLTTWDDPSRYAPFVFTALVFAIGFVVFQRAADKAAEYV